MREINLNKLINIMLATLSVYHFHLASKSSLELVLTTWWYHKNAHAEENAKFYFYIENAHNNFRRWMLLHNVGYGEIDPYSFSHFLSICEE